jgi:glycerol-3-phosphate dehydrogenase
MAGSAKKEETTPLVAAPSTSTSTSSAPAYKKAKPIYTEEKARHLFRVYGAILTIFFLQGWMTIMLVEPLKEQEKLMVCCRSTYLINITYGFFDTKLELGNFSSCH